MKKINPTEMAILGLQKELDRAELEMIKQGSTGSCFFKKFQSLVQVKLANRNSLPNNPDF